MLRLKLNSEAELRDAITHIFGALQPDVEYLCGSTYCTETNDEVTPPYS